MLLELDEGILQRVAGDFVADDFASFDSSEAAEDDLKVVIGCDRVQLADEQNVFRWRNVGVRNVTDNLQNRRSSLRLAILQHLLNFSFGLALRVIDVFIRSDSPVSQAFRCRRWASAGLTESSGVGVGIFKDNRVSDSDVFVRSVLVVDDRLVQHSYDFMSLNNLANHAVKAIERRQFTAQSDEELRSDEVFTC